MKEVGDLDQDYICTKPPSDESQCEKIVDNHLDLHGVTYKEFLAYNDISCKNKRCQVSYRIDPVYPSNDPDLRVVKEDTNVELSISFK